MPVFQQTDALFASDQSLVLCILILKACPTWLISYIISYNIICLEDIKQIEHANAHGSLSDFLFSSCTTLAIFSYYLHLLSRLSVKKYFFGYKIIIANELELNRNS